VIVTPNRWLLLACALTAVVCLCEGSAQAQELRPEDLQALVDSLHALSQAPQPTQAGWGPVLAPVIGSLGAVILGLVGYSREQAKAERAREQREAGRDAKLRQRVRTLEDHVDTLSDDCHYHAGCFVAVQDAVPNFRPPARAQRRSRKRPDDSDDASPTPKESR
jgi:hypothetical protein